MVNLIENSEVFNSEFSVLSIVQNGKLGIGKPRSLIKVPQRTLRGFQPEFSVLGIVPSEKPRKTDSARFPSFLRTPSFPARLESLSFAEVVVILSVLFT